MAEMGGAQHKLHRYGQCFGCHWECLANKQSASLFVTFSPGPEETYVVAEESLSALLPE